MPDGRARLLPGAPHRESEMVPHEPEQSPEGDLVVLASVFGALPFVLSGGIADPIDALFESASGFTTTGSPPWQLSAPP